MRRPSSRLAAMCAFLVAMLISAAGAAAGNGNGNENAPGQQKQEQAQAQAQQATSQPAAPQQQWPDQQGAAQQPQQQADHGSKGAAKHEQQASSSSDAAPGVKPSNSTTKWTHCKTGGTSSNATCTAQAGTPNTKPDVSKRYGNGKTAAQIAVSRGAPAGTLITGPGNSQPHKVSDCRRKSNKSGGVDVHAVKSYSATCAETKPEASKPEASKPESCGTSEHGKGHEKHEGSCGSEKPSCGTKHHEAGSTCSCGSTSTCSSATTTTTVTTAAAPTPPVTTTVAVVTPAPTTTTTATVTETTSVAAAAAVQNTPPSQVSALPATQGLPSTASAASASAPVQSSGGVLGAQTTLGKPKAKSGVLGTVGNVAGSTLPFTGFPVWLAVLIALALGLAGFAMYRRNAAARL